MTKISDPIVSELVAYMRDYLNEQYLLAYGKGRLVVTTREYDAYLVPLTEFPLLKMFRRSLDFEAIDLRSSSIAAVLSFANADIEEMPALLYWVANHFITGIHQWGISNAHKAKIDRRIQASVTTSVPGDTLLYQLELNLQLRH
jgi:hypothetical protein